MLHKTGVLLIVLVMAGMVMAQGGPPPMVELDGEIIAEGLNAPQGVFVDSEGTLWIVDSGNGGDEMIEFIDPMTFEVIEAAFGETSRVLRLVDGELEEVALLPSVAVGQDFLGGARLTEIDGTAYVTVGVWHANNGDEATVPYFGEVVRLTDDGVETVGSLWEFERENNPDGTTNVETHPYDIMTGPDGQLYIADAAANALLRMNPDDGTTELVAAFEGQTGVFPSPWRDGEAIADPVPTGVTFDGEGNLYVSYLSGAPFIPGTAKIVQISDDGEVSDFAPGLTMLTDLTTGPDGYLYATQFGMFTQEGPVANSGNILRILEDGTAEVVVDGLPFLTGIAFNEAGDAYVTVNGIAIPSGGLVVLYEDLVSMEGTPYELPMMESGG